MISITDSKINVAVEMESWELMKLLSAEQIALVTGRSLDLARKWRRPRPDDENPLASGERNPVDLLDLLFDAALVHNPEFSKALIERYLGKLEQFNERQGVETRKLRDRIRKAG